MPRIHEEYPVNREAITRAPTHPGAFFHEEVLPHLGRRTIGEIATLLGVSRQTLYRVMEGQTAVTPDMAVRLGKLCGNGPELWLNMQARFDAGEASKRLSRTVKKIPTIRE